MKQKDEDKRLVRRLSLYVCKHCGHEWDDGNKYYCGCGGPYRIPNPAIRDTQNVKRSEPDQK